jgi:hypothetical protein
MYFDMCYLGIRVREVFSNGALNTNGIRLGMPLARRDRTKEIRYSSTFGASRLEN